MAQELGYLVVNVDAGQTRVHMLHEVFFRIAEQVDLEAALPEDGPATSLGGGYPTDTVDAAADSPVVEEIGRAGNVDEGIIGLELRNSVYRYVTGNASMSRDFRVAMTQLCLAEMGTGNQNQEAVPLVEWLTGVNRRVSSVRRYSIYNSVVRTNARYFLESLLHWEALPGTRAPASSWTATGAPQEKSP